MEIIFELLFQFLGEVLLQIVLEVLFEFGLHSLKAPFNKQPHPLLAGTGYAIFGAVAGGLSLWAFPNLFIALHRLQVANLVLAPVAAGLSMMALGAWRRRREQELILLDRFAYGFIFALAMALVRFRFGQH